MSINTSPPRLGGISEVAAELGVTRQQVTKLRATSDFPAPVASLAVGDIWDLDVVRRWSGSGLRRNPGRPTTPSRPVALGRRFELAEVIGGGGFAVVHSARDLESASDARVAVKVLQEAHALDQDTVTRFRRELELLGRLSDPHVMPVLANGTDRRLGLWYAMPLAWGNLADVLRQRPPIEDIVAIMREICAGLEYIHSHGVLHRDLKPENILRTPEGTWALADFGLARAVAEDSIRLTVTGDAMGTRFYTAPEQFSDAKRVDERADVYSAGRILQALIIGSTPIDDDLPPGPLRPVVLKAIHSNRERRYDSAAELLAAIEVTIAAPVGKWATPEEKAARLRPRLQGPSSIDNDAIAELRAWADSADPADYTEMGELAITLTALSVKTIRRWWNQDPGGFTRVFEAFAERLNGGFVFEVCDNLADFARRAVTATEDGVILRETTRGLAQLGENHNRWHVRDITIAILQAIRTDEDAVAALEGLRAAGKSATEWSVPDASRRTLQPILRAGLAAFLDEH